MAQHDSGDFAIEVGPDNTRLPGVHREKPLEAIRAASFAASEGVRQVWQSSQGRSSVVANPEKPVPLLPLLLLEH